MAERFYHDRDGNVVVRQPVNLDPANEMPDAATDALIRFHLPMGRLPNTTPFIEREP